MQSGLFSSSSHRREAKPRRGRSISSETSIDAPPLTRLRVSQEQTRTQTPLSELSALTKSSDSTGISDSDLPVDCVNLPVTTLLKCGVHGEKLYKILLGRRKVKAETPVCKITFGANLKCCYGYADCAFLQCGQCVKKGRTCFIGRFNKRGRPTKNCIYCQSYSVSCSLGG